jgi:hypothetical protein
MILYYTVTQKTKVFAEALHEALGLPIYELKSKLGGKVNFSFIAKALYLAISGKSYPLDNIPASIDAGEIYLCAPVWGGRPAGPAWYFLQNAGLKGKKVNLVLTCSRITGEEKYKKNALDILEKTDCVPGEVYIFATNENEMPERETIAEQLRDMLKG